MSTSQPIISVQQVGKSYGKFRAIENISLDIEFMKRWDEEKQEYVLLSGKYEFLIGASSDDIRIELSADLP